MSTQSIQEKSLIIRNETIEEANSKERIADVIDDINLTKLDKGNYIGTAEDLYNKFEGKIEAGYNCIPKVGNGESGKVLTDSVVSEIYGKLGIGLPGEATEKLEVNGNIKADNLKAKSTQFQLQSSINPTPNTLVPKTDGSGLIWYDNSSAANELFYIPQNWVLGRTPNNSYNYNTRIGVETMLSISEGENNVGIGRRALEKLTTGGYNTAIGNYAGNFITTSNHTVFLGTFAGHFNTASNYLTNTSNSVYIGDYTKGTENAINETVIGYNASGNGSNTVTLGHTTIVNTYLRGKVNLNNRLKLASYTKTQRDALTNKEVGDIIWQTDSGNSGIRVFDGTNWLALQTTID